MRFQQFFRATSIECAFVLFDCEFVSSVGIVINNVRKTFCNPRSVQRDWIIDPGVGVLRYDFAFC